MFIGTKQEVTSEETSTLVNTEVLVSMKLLHSIITQLKVKEGLNLGGRQGELMFFFGIH